MSRLMSNDTPICAEPGSTDEGISSSKKECTSCEHKNDIVGASCELLNDMSISGDKSADSISNTCANCGKEGSEVTNTCNKCKMVMYCNAACKKKHRHKHKKDCEEHLRRVAKLHDEVLFKQPPPAEDCPICFVRMPTLDSGSKYKTCCGKMICSGCIHAVKMRDRGVGLCPFCRSPAAKDEEEAVKRVKKLMEAGDADAMYNLGNHYYHGECGFPQNFIKALELFHQAAELGSAEAYCNIGNAYYSGRGAHVDEKKGIHYYELAAMKGDATARYNLGFEEEAEGNMDRALKHHMIAVGSGYSSSLDAIKNLYMNGQATKDVYTAALQAYQIYLGEIKSVQRDTAAETRDDYKYY